MLNFARTTHASLTLYILPAIVGLKDSFNANVAKVAAVAMTLAPAAAMATEGTNEVRQLLKCAPCKT